MNESTALTPIVSDGLPTRLIGADPALEFIEHLENRWRLAKYMVASGMVPQKRAEEVVVVMLKGYELGIPPMMAAANIHVIKGTPALSAHLQLGLAAQRAGVRWHVLEHTDRVCRIRFSRPGWDEHTEEFTIEQAEKMNLTGKDNWKNDPKAMLFARCSARGARAIAPDVLAGSYTYEEAESFAGPANGGTTDDLNAVLRSKQEPTEEVETAAGDSARPDSAGTADEGPVDSDALQRAEARFQELMDARHEDWKPDNRLAWARAIIGHNPESADDYNTLNDKLSKVTA